MKAILIDFEDSFTFNLAQELNEAGFEVKVLPWDHFETEPLGDVLVLGPGPGHPDDYQKIFPIISKWLLEKKPFMAVCLGHQIFWRIKGEKVQRSLLPMHGQKIPLNLTSDWRNWLNIHDVVYVQRYNSLMVSSEFSFHDPELINFIQNEEVLITRSDHVISYQFHPESVGTSFRQNFIKAVWSIINK